MGPNQWSRPVFSTAKEAQHEEPRIYVDRSNVRGVPAVDYS